MITRCANVVTWIELGTRVRCHRAADHPGEHRDRLWAWDDDGLRVDGTDHAAPGVERPPEPRGYRSLDDHEVLIIRDRLDAGQSIADTARTMHLSYQTVYAIARGETYRSVRRTA